MKRVVAYFCINALFLMIISCSGNTYCSLPTTETEFANKTEAIINSSKVNFDLLGAREVIVCDTFLVFLTKNPQGYLKIYSTNSFNLICEICKQGRAKNEFNNPTSMFGYTYSLNNEQYLSIIDNRSILKEINLSQSAKKNTAIVSSTTDYPAISDGYSFLLSNDPDNQFITYKAHVNASSDDCEAPKYYIKNKEKKRELKVFRKAVNADNALTGTTVYTGGFIRHPSKDIFIQVFNYMDYMLLFNFEKNTFKAIHQEGSLSFNDYFDSKWSMVGDKEIYHFGSGTCTDNLVFFLYGAGDYCIKAKDYNPSETPKEILLFDWEGIYLGGAKLDVIVHSIAYDEKHKVLFGLNRRNDSVYRFDISEIIENIE